MTEDTDFNRIDNMLRTAIKWKFPGIRDLTVEELKVSFSGDGVHTKEIILAFIEELKRTGNDNKK